MDTFTLVRVRIVQTCPPPLLSDFFWVSLGDGSLRVYDLQTVKVVKAIQALGDEVASIACLPKPNQNLDDVFLSVGRRVGQLTVTPQSAPDTTV